MIQPYQIFFPIGMLYALWGVLIWLFYLAGWMSYPGSLHAHLMIGGFLFSFALGFLMTAVPRFTGARPAKSWEIVVGALLSVASFFGAHQDGIALSILVFLAVFFLSRFRERTHSPPKHFVFIPLGLAFGIAGALMMILGVGPGRVFLFQGTMLCFVLGVGGKLVGALLGWSSQPLVQITVVGTTKREPVIPLNIAVPFTVLALGFLLELTEFQGIGRVLRALSAVFVAIDAWKLHRLPKNQGRLVNWLWVSSWGLILGLALYAFVPFMGIHGLHLMFICGFGLMTLMIASRVTLAHGGYDLEIEINSRAIRWAGALTLLAAGARTAAPLTSTYMDHLGYAAALWIAALVIWSGAFLPKILKSAG